jgi:hypothetical protein
METFIILLGLMLSGVVITTFQILLDRKKEKKEITELFEEIQSN